jgi:urea transport system permease protein
VKAEIKTALALRALGGTDQGGTTRTLWRRWPDGRSPNSAIVATLTEKSTDGTFAEPDAKVRAAAASAVAGIDTKLWWYSGVETLFFGLSLGSILVLVAIGSPSPSVSWGDQHGARELMMLGAYTTYVVLLLMPNHLGSRSRRHSGGVSRRRGCRRRARDDDHRRLYGRPLETLLARSASASCCSSSCGHCSPPTIAPCRRRRG